MAYVTDKQFYMDEGLKTKLDLVKYMIEKDNDDGMLCISGETGSGKTSLAIAIGYYMSKELKRPFSVDNVFFDPDKMIDFAINNKEQIIIWDESALGGLGNQHMSQIQRKLLMCLMTCRLFKHFFIFNAPKFKKLTSYIREESFGLIHTYKVVKIGQKSKYRYMYIGKQSKNIYNECIEKGRSAQNLKKFTNFYGMSPNPKYFEDVIDKNAYEKKKIEAIKSIGKEDKKKVDKNLIKLKALRYLIYHKLDRYQKQELSKLFGINRKTLYVWGQLEDKNDETTKEVYKNLDNGGFVMP